MIGCPPEDLLHLFVFQDNSESASDTAIGEIRSHCETCESCRAIVLRLQTESGLLTKLMEFAPPSLLDASVSEDADDSDRDALLSIGGLIPGYDLIRQIHRGGQGVVYEALQQATKRPVAIKVMREGPFAGPSEHARFEREIQLLASVKHPNVVTIHDSGVASGCFYFVMDYIEGKPLDEHVEEAALGARETLALFVHICEAVNAIHLRGVIHRDLKPHNIRVDLDGVPHVLDFGLARGMSGGAEGVAPREMMTMTGQFVGSPPWASPEQAAMMPDQIDFRCDVYSLGVILYQLLTGRFPYDVTGNIWDVLERIRQVEPNKPGAYRPEIDTDVETILLKCLSKSKERRYQTAGELARDIRHYLNNEPIEARRESTLYVLGKTVQRYRAPVAAALAFLVMLVVALVVSLSLWYLAEQRSSELKVARENEALARGEAEAARVRAEERAEDALHKLYGRYAVLAAGSLEENSTALTSLLKQCPPEQRGWEWRYLKWLSDRSLMTIPTTNVAEVVQFSPDGHRVIAATRDGIVHEYDVATDQERLALDLQRGVVIFDAAYSPDGSRIVARNDHGVVRVWAAQDGEPLWSVAGDTGNNSGGCAYSPDGQTLATGEESGAIALRDPESGEVRHVWRIHEGDISTLRFSADGERIASFGLGDPIRVWNGSTGEVIAEFTGHTGPVFDIDLSADGLRGASGGPDRLLYIWDSTSGQLVHALAHPLPVNALRFSPDGKSIATGCKDGALRIWDASTGALRHILRGHLTPIHKVAYSPDGSRIATAVQITASVSGMPTPRPNVSRSRMSRC